MDVPAYQVYMIYFRTALYALQMEMIEFYDCLANGSSPLAAYVETTGFYRAGRDVETMNAASEPPDLLSEDIP